MTAEPLLSVKDLSVAFRQGERQMLAVDAISFDIKKGETLALVGESGSGKSVTALSIMKLLPYPAASHPSGQIMFKGLDLLSLPEREIREIRGADITIIFQEPMTSLNPLHTIERQIGEILLLHRGLTGQVARVRIIELLTQVGIPDPASRLKSYPHQIVRRPAPARDDRDGARQRARPADRRRADDRAGRHRPGANPQIAQGVAGPARDGHAVHHARPRHRAQDRRPGLRDEGRQDRRGKRGRAAVRGAAASLHARVCWRPSRRCRPRRSIRPAKWSCAPTISRSGFPSGAASCARPSASSRRSTVSASRCARARRSAWSASSGSGKTTLGLAILRLISSDGPIVFMGNELQDLRFKGMLPFRRNMQIVFQDPYGSLSPRMSIVRHHPGGLVDSPAAYPATRVRTAGDPRRWTTSVSTRKRGSAIRTNSPAASASASRSRAPSCWSRPSSCWTSPPARSTC